MRKPHMQKLYDSTADIYNERYGPIQEEKYKIMLEDLEFKGPVLDLGSGTGLLQKFLKGKLYGIDISFASIKKSSELVVQGDAEQLPYKNNTFNTVLSFTTAQNLDSVENMLKEVSRVLKPKGIAVITILAKFMDKLSNAERYFQILEIKTCGEDVGLVLASDK